MKNKNTNLAAGCLYHLKSFPGQFLHPHPEYQIQFQTLIRFLISRNHYHHDLGIFCTYTQIKILFRTGNFLNAVI